MISGMQERELLVRFAGAGFRFDRDVALEAVDLEVLSGERLAVLGPNGGGKTTLLSLMLGLRRPSAGRVEHLRREPPLRRGYVPQFPAFDRSFPVRVEEMVLEGRLRQRSSGRAADGECRAAVRRQLERLELLDLRRAYLTELSGGELKRALVARALVGEPELLVLDEPTASLDASARATFWELLSELPPRTTVVLAAHDIAPATFAPTRALLVDRQVRELGQEAMDAHALLCGHGRD